MTVLRTALTGLVVASVSSTVLAKNASGSNGWTLNFDSVAPYAHAGLHPEWASMLQRHEKSRPSFELCFAKLSSCVPQLRGYRTLVKKTQGVHPRGKIMLANRFMNKRKRVPDEHREFENENSSWASPLEFLIDGGDCEDFAIAKYFLLRDMGIAASDMRVVITYERYLRAYHAVLAVRIDGRIYILENDDTIKTRQQHRHYDFAYAINENSFWDYGTRDVTRRYSKSM